MKVDVVITNYNKGPYIGAALDSVLCQKTDKLAEIIICDDGSTDNSFHVIAQYQAKFPSKIRLIRNEKNLGACKNTRLAFYQGNSPLIAGLDADDVWSDENKIEIMVKYLEENPELIAVIHAVDILNQAGNVETSGQYVDINKHFPDKFTKISATDVLSISWGSVYLSAGFMLIRRDVLDKIFTKDFNQYYDITPYMADSFRYALYYYIQDKPLLGYINQPMAYYRSGDHNQKNLINAVKHNVVYLTMFARYRLVFKDSEILNKFCTYALNYYYPIFKRNVLDAKLRGETKVIAEAYGSIINAKLDELYELIEFDLLFGENRFDKFRREVRQKDLPRVLSLYVGSILKPMARVAYRNLYRPYFQRLIYHFVLFIKNKRRRFGI